MAARLVLFFLSMAAHTLASEDVLNLDDPCYPDPAACALNFVEKKHKAVLGVMTAKATNGSFLAAEQVLTPERSLLSLNMTVALDQTSTDAFLQAFSVIAVAELFDKTWFMALLCAMSFGPGLAFCASFAALVIHVLIAALMGIVFARLLRRSVLDFLAAGVMAILAVLYAWDWASADADGDAIADRAEDAKEDMRSIIKADQSDSGTEVVSTDSESNDEKVSFGIASRSFIRCFIGIFIAEWGDRTQLAMISLQSSQPVVPVCLGSVAAFFVLTLSAVAAATLLKGVKLSQRLVLAVSTVSFLLFAVVSAAQGYYELRQERSSKQLH